MAAEISLPNITQDDLIAFHARTFGSVPPQGSLPQNGSANATNDFSDGPEDNLGFYPDGKKRTLTDEQIAMFRSSEIYGIIREREVARENMESERDREVVNAVATSTSQAPQVSIVANVAIAPSSEKPPNARNRHKKQKFEPRTKQAAKQVDDVPSRRVIRELDDIQAEEQVMDY